MHSTIRINTILFVAAFFFCMSCGKEKHQDWIETDLLEFGVPVKILTPKDVDIKTSQIKGSIVLSKGKDYGLDVYSSDATVISETEIKGELMAIVKDMRFFDSIIQEENNGFVYKLTIDSINTSYGFRKVMIQGSNQIIFQNAIMSSLDEEQAKLIYESLD